ncbi:MAG: sigma-70 family RNA polymerase sigma factor, partial [Clostridia bacterium]|nr:sigma-70 family RNA polymerase sigma factor [Clostridia bacterium]
RGVDYEDLLQIGAMGLLRAARAFSFDYGCLFSTYAVPLIIGEIKRYLRDDGAVKVSRTVKSRAVLLMHKREELIRQGQDDPPLSRLAEACGISYEEASEAMAACAPVASLNRTEHEDAAPLDYYLSEASDPSDSLCEHIALQEAIRKLTPLQQQIVYLRYHRDLAQSDVGRILSLSQVKVSREEKKILSLLRNYLTQG